MKFLESSLVALDVEAATPDEAIRAAGSLLVREGAVEERYVDAMIESYHNNGPYFVLAPKIALPHARPEDGVSEASVSFVRLKNPVVFGNAANDPVTFVFALGASTSDQHLQILQKLMLLLGDQSNVGKLQQATNYKDIKTLIGGKE
ncbi:PTS sugar transporter subunit IIA [Mesobacillus sp. AQ2]|uniref:PTS sugar transporter subunit IIA n=1 Tax=Bacillaceae TaxID=186817 RepID=UPI0011A56DAD|nr:MULTISPECIES: PTS sugar transporter subunit IIA [Bacillaceae]WHX40361.1 PTS sugar transporter subunit IIA [Mesobacillus sp. AQ2]